MIHQPNRTQIAASVLRPTSYFFDCDCADCDQPRWRLWAREIAAAVVVIAGLLAAYAMLVAYGF